MIVCQKCGKENQDHYKFCLGCGAELSQGDSPQPFGSGPDTNPAPAMAPAPQAAAPAAAPVAQQPAAAPEPAAPAPAAPAPAAAPAAAPADGAGTVTCPQCNAVNPPNNRFCASCGYNLSALQAAAAAPAAAAPGPAAAGGDVILTALRADGSEAGSFPLPDGPSVVLGRDTGSIFAGDSYLSPRHATFTRKDGGISVKDEGSLNGVYLKIHPNAPWPLGYGDVFRIGQEIIRFESLDQQAPSDGVQRLGSPARGYIGRLALVIGRDTTGNAFPVPETGVHCGRERGDILFSEDGYVSGLHCRIGPEQDGNIYLTDVGSSNGTFIRLKKEYTLNPGDILLMGQQLFRVDM